MLGAVRKEEEKFGACGNFLGGVQQERAYLPPQRTAAGLAGMEEIHAALRQLIFQQADERALPCAFYAFYSKEHCLSSCLSFFFSALPLRFSSAGAGAGVRTGRQRLRPRRFWYGLHAMPSS